MRILAFLLSANLLGAACVQVSADKIKAADLARALPQFTAMPAGEFIGFAPVPGYRRLIPGSMLASLGERYGIQLPPGSEACFERETELLTAERITATLRKSFADERIAIELVEFSRYRVPKGTLRFPAYGLTRRPISPQQPGVVWRGEIMDESGHINPVWVKVNLWEEREQMTAATPIRAGETITAEQIRTERVRAFPQQPSSSFTLRDIVGQIARTNISAGQVLTAAHVRPRSDVNRGDRVVIAVVARGVRLLFTADAESSGSAGHTITARGPWGKQPLHAVVEGPGRAKVEVR